MPLLQHAELQQIVTTAVQAGLASPNMRSALLAGVNPLFGAQLGGGGNPVADVLTDLTTMNNVERLADGSVPLKIWLSNAALLTATLVHSETFRAALHHLDEQGGQPPVPANIPEKQEEIIHQDDMVPFHFLQRGATAGLAVAQLEVPRFNNGVAALLPTGSLMVYEGSGWLLTPDLLVTNYHVINARDKGEPVAAVSDLESQAARTIAIFDYDGENLPGRRVAVTRLEVAGKPPLDFAILRLSQPAGNPLVVCGAPLVSSHAGQVAVNIIQHPDGRPKKAAIRNNLVTATDATDVRYFTDTRGGSSGSPVFDDLWRVIALHRGAAPVSNVKFQGRTTAWVNVGTQITAVLQAVKAGAGGLWTEITAKGALDNQHV